MIFISVTARDRDMYIAFVFYGVGLQRVHGDDICCVNVMRFLFCSSCRDTLESTSGCLPVDFLLFFKLTNSYMILSSGCKL